MALVDGFDGGKEREFWNHGWTFDVAVTAGRKRHFKQGLQFNGHLVKGLGRHGQRRLAEQVFQKGQSPEFDRRGIAQAFHRVECRSPGRIIGHHGVAKHDASARPADPHHFGERLLWLLEVVEREPATDDVKRRICERQSTDIALLP